MYASTNDLALSTASEEASASESQESDCSVNAEPAVRAEGESPATIVKHKKNDYAKRMRRCVASDPISAPVVIRPDLIDLSFLSFHDFLSLPETQALIGLNNDSAELLSRLVQDRVFMLLRISKHGDNRELSRRMLGEFVRRVYLGDRRGIRYWRRISKVLWIAYENHLRLRYWARRVRNDEIARIARWEARAVKERARLQAKRSEKKKQAAA